MPILALCQKTMPYDLIIFDCDGTLVDSEYLNNYAMLEILYDHGLHQYTMDYALKHCVGKRFSKILAQITAETGVIFPDDIAATYNKRVTALAPTYLKPIDGARETVELAMQYAEVCVVSNGERSNVLNSLTQTGLRDYFGDDFIVSALMAPNPKPAPDLFLYGAALKGIVPEKCLVIEDSLVGATAGIAAGMEVWGVTYAHHAPQIHEKALLDLGVADVFHSTEEKRAALSKRYGRAA